MKLTAEVRNGWSYSSISLYSFMVCIGTPLPSTLYTILHLYHFRHHVSSFFCTFFMEVDNKEDINGDTLCHCICCCKMQWCGKSWGCFEIVLLMWYETEHKCRTNLSRVRWVWYILLAECKMSVLSLLWNVHLYMAEGSSLWETRFSL
jgi:hypothetical protein